MLKTIVEDEDLQASFSVELHTHLVTVGAHRYCESRNLLRKLHGLIARLVDPRENRPAVGHHQMGGT